MERGRKEAKQAQAEQSLKCGNKRSQEEATADRKQATASVRKRRRKATCRTTQELKFYILLGVH